MKRSFSAARRGLTLIELVVVMAIVAVLAMMVIPRLDFLKTQAEHAASAGTQADLGTMIQTFKTSSGYYPTFDTLLDTSGAVYSKLQQQTAGAFLDVWSVPAAGGPPTGSWYRSLAEAGFQYGYNHSTTASDASSSGTAAQEIPTAASAGTLKLATLKETGGDASQLAAAIRTTIYPGGAQYNQASAGVDGIQGTTDDVAASTSVTDAGVIPPATTTPPYTGKKLLVVGIGAKTNLLGKIMVSAPTSAMQADDSKATYCRYLAIFEVSQDGSPAKLKLIVDHRGRQIGARIDQYKANSAIN